MQSDTYISQLTVTVSDIAGLKREEEAHEAYHPVFPVKRTVLLKC